MFSIKIPVMTDEKLLERLLKSGMYEHTSHRTCRSLGISSEKMAELLLNSGNFHIYPSEIMKYMRKKGVTYFDMVAVYGFDLLCLSKTFFQHKPEYYYGKSVNYLKILGHVQENKGVYFICECLACGSKDYKIKKHHAINGTVRSCGCLPKGKRIPDKFPVKNETLQTELQELTESLIEAGVLFNLESKIVNKIKKGADSAEKIALELNCELAYVYKIARKRGYSEQINQYTFNNIRNKNMEKTRKIMKAAQHGTTKSLCQAEGIDFNTYAKYRKIIENERISKTGV